MEESEKTKKYPMRHNYNLASSPTLIDKNIELGRQLKQLKAEANQEDFIREMEDIQEEIGKQKSIFEMETAQLETVKHIHDRTSRDLL